MKRYFLNKTLLLRLMIVAVVSFTLAGCTNSTQSNKIENTNSATITIGSDITPVITPSPSSVTPTIEITNGTKSSPQKSGNISSNADSVIACNEIPENPIGPGFIYYKLFSSGKVEIKIEPEDDGSVYVKPEYKNVGKLGPVKKAYSGFLNGQIMCVIFLMRDGYIEKLDVNKAKLGTIESAGRIPGFDNIIDIQQVDLTTGDGQTVYAVKKDGSKIAISSDNVK